MKKIFKITSMLFIAAALFTACKQNADAPSGTSFDDCTTTATEVTLADGNWTVKVVMSADGMSGETNIKATVTSGSYTFKSGSGTQTVDLSKMMDADELAAFNALSDAEKKQIVISNMNCPEDATITFDGNKVTVKADLSASVLANMQSDMDLTDLPNDAVIKTNSDKTKYTISYTESGITETIYISKD